LLFSLLNKHKEAFMQDIAGTRNFICPGLVIDLKKVYNVNGHTDIKASKSYEQTRLAQIVGKVKHVWRK